jgi:predicted house-cleaning noncanonical NTP pyrophosphatase (MazG superfamily)
MKYDKLVRDKIPEIITKAGKKCIVRTAAPSEYKEYLFKKIIEEVEELKAASTIDNVKEEVADVFTVLCEICKINNINFAETVTQQIAKETKNGSFSKRIILVEVLEND